MVRAEPSRAVSSRPEGLSRHSQDEPEIPAIRLAASAPRGNPESAGSFDMSRRRLSCVDIVPADDNVKVTLSLTRRSIDFFKREAKRRRVPYQRMIRALVDEYSVRQGGRGGKR
jgi:hypothetical protein